MNFSAWALLISNILVITLIFVLNKFKTQKKLTVLFNCVFVCQLIWNSCLFLQILLAEPLHIQPIYFDYFTYIGVVFLPVFLYIASQVFTKPNFKIKKTHNSEYNYKLAGVSGFEPEQSVLETLILPLYYTPIDKNIVTYKKNVFNLKNIIRKHFFYIIK